MKNKKPKFQIGDFVKVRAVMFPESYGIVIENGRRPDITVRVFGITGNKCWYHPDCVKLIARA